jgi:hypothetical protein
MTRRKHYVRFQSPGTFVHEESRREIDEWDVKAALDLSAQILERHNSRPFAFIFETYLESDPIDDGEGGKLNVQPKFINKSGRHFIGGNLISIDAIRKRKAEDERILLSNMEGNQWAFVVENCNSWKMTQVFDKDDLIVEKGTGRIIARGTDPDIVERQAALVAEREAYYAKQG